MHFADLRYQVHGAVARIAFDRPAHRNALGDTTVRQLVGACRAAGADPTVRALVITGEGDAFCAGGDFQDTFERGAGQTEAQWSERIRSGPNELVRVLQALPKPVVACVNGVAAGGGATIALACDLRIASDRARFVFPFVHAGITPEFGCTHLLPKVVGLGCAMELLLQGDPIDADEALRIGLVNRVVPHAELEAATVQWLSRLVAVPAGAQGSIKTMLHRAQSADLATALEAEAQALGRAFTSAEHRTAVAAFLARRRGAGA